MTMTHQNSQKNNTTLMEINKKTNKINYLFLFPKYMA